MARRRKNAYKPGASAEPGHDVAALSRHRGSSTGYARSVGVPSPPPIEDEGQQSGRMSKRTIDTFARRAAFGAVLTAAAAAVLADRVSAQQLSADCERLREAIADASRGDSGAQYQAAADRQRAELDRTAAYAHSIGCDRRQFLFFGAAPPPQCGEINAQIGRMRANLDELQQRAGGGPGGRGETIARFNAQCTTAQRQPQQQQPTNLFDAIFGGGARQPDDVQTAPLNPEQPIENSEAQAGSKAVCVRSCDGSFFPVSYSASQGRLTGLEDMCRALCPNADVSLYTYPPSGQIEQAVSINGAKYMDSPNALKYRQSLDPTCSCKPKGESWADALAGAEAKLGRESKGDVFVTPEKSIELSRPKLDAKTKAKTPADAKATPAAPAADPGVDALSQQAASISREASGIAGGEAQTGAKYGEGQGQTVETVGPDGVKRKVRIIDPTL
jgi:hypothetical protein